MKISHRRSIFSNCSERLIIFKFTENLSCMTWTLKNSVFERGCIIWSNEMFREDYCSLLLSLQCPLDTYFQYFKLPIIYFPCNSEIATFACSLNKVDSSRFFWFHRNFMPWTVYHNCFSGRNFMWNQMNQSLILVPSFI